MKRLSLDAHGNPRRFFSRHKLAEMLDVHPRTISRLIADKKLEAYSVAGSTIRIPAEEVDRFLRERSIGRQP